MKPSVSEFIFPGLIEAGTEEGTGTCYFTTGFQRERSQRRTTCYSSWRCDFSVSGAGSDQAKSFTELMPIRTNVCTKQILVIYGIGVEDARQTTNPMGWQHVTIN